MSWTIETRLGNPYQVDALHVHLVDDEDERLVPVRVQVARFDLQIAQIIGHFN